MPATAAAEPSAFPFFEIDAQELGSALNAFALQSGRELLFDEEEVADETTAGVHGRVEPIVALERVLATAGLGYRINELDTILVGRAATTGEPNTMQAENTPQATRPTGLRRLTNALATAFAALGVAVVGAPGSAEEAGGTDADVIEEVLVTAQKREEALSDVPLTIQAAEGEFLDSNNVKNLRDYVKFIPGATQGGGFSTVNARFQLRGIPQEAGDPTVGYYIGDAPFYYPGQIFAPIVRTVGLERVEVLKGPQSTLYGNGAMGGVIRIIPKEPNLEAVEGSVRGGYSTFADGGDGHSVDATFSVPLVAGKLGVRLSVSDEEEGGFITVQPSEFSFATFGLQPSAPPRHDFGSHEVQDMRLQVLATPTDQLTLKLLGIANDTSIAPTGFLLLEPRRPPLAAEANPDEATNEMEYDLWSATVNYDFERVSLTSVVTQIKYEELWVASYPLTLGEPYVISQDVDSVSNETRLVSNLDGRWQWLAGVFYTEADWALPVVIPEIAILGVPELVLVAYGESEQLSFFAETSYELIEGKLTGLVGLRHFQDKRRWWESAPLPETKDDFDSINPRFNLAYTPSDNALYFVNVAKGFRSGVRNSLAGCISIPVDSPLFPVCPETIDSDELWSYEFGTKQTLLDGRLAVGATLYYQEWSDVQGGVRPGSATVNFGLGDADGFGVDIGISWSPATVPGLDVLFSANWNNMEFSSVKPDIGNAFGDLFQAGAEIPTVPPFSSTLSIDYERVLTGRVSGQFAFTWNHRAGHTPTIGSTFDAKTRNFMNLRTGVRIGENLGIHFFTTNLFDEDATIWGQDGPLYPGSGWRMIDPPRRYGVEVRYDF